MSTPTATTQTDRQRAELIVLIAAATRDLAQAWALLPSGQDALLRRLERIHPGRGSINATRDAILLFNRTVAAFNRDAAAVAERWAAQDLPTAYRDGAIRALHAVEESARRFSWNPDHQAAITGLTATYWADLMRRITEAVRRAQAFARAAQDAMRIAGSIDTAGLLRAHPLDSVVYANQTRHPVKAWARSAFSWQGVVVANSGAINIARLELGTQWMQVADGPECGFQTHDDHDHADGTIRSIDDCEAFPAAHHGCIRSLTPRPDLTGRLDITSGDPA